MELGGGDDVDASGAVMMSLSSSRVWLANGRPMKLLR